MNGSRFSIRASSIHWCGLTLAFLLTIGCDEGGPSSDAGGTGDASTDDAGGGRSTGDAGGGSATTVEDGSVRQDSATTGGNGGEGVSTSAGSTGGSGSGGSEDGGSGGSGGTDGGAGATTEPTPSGVEAFIAAGFGGRTILSCDQGRTWIADQQVASWAEDDWHQSFTPQGVAWANGAFVFLTGWGVNGTARRTTDGIHWTVADLPGNYGGIGVTDGQFVALGGSGVLTSEDGVDWEESDAPLPVHNRQTDAFDELWVGAADSSVIVAQPGEDWVDRSASCPGVNVSGIGQSGGWAAGLGMVVLVGDGGNTCAFSLADGSPLGSGSTGGEQGGKPFFMGDSFWVASRTQLHRSTNGIDWSSQALPGGVVIDLLARSASGTYVGASADGSDFYFSDDGESWEPAAAPEGTELTLLQFGYVEPSVDCPAP